MYCGSIIPKMVKNKRDLNTKYSPHKTARVTRRSASKLTEKVSSASTTNANIKVVVRVRPPNQKELGSNSRTVIKVVDEDALIFDPKQNEEPFYYHGVAQRGRDLLKKANKNIQFNFDRVFGYEDNNDDVFKDSTKNLILSLMDGYNCSVFVYGATGAGKTHTMLGHNGNPGITLLTMQELFRQMHELKDERDFELGITYLEVYNETVKDLLNPGCPLHLREDGKFGVCVPGIELKRIFNAEELFALLEKGNCNRTQHPTDANAESSRSHAVFQVYVNTVMRKTGQRRIAKLSMIDLAGSERGAATGCKGMRFTEGANINKSLLALGNCINSLADGRAHVPYRDSKLTRLLKDSLGGNCQTVMIANISPSSLNYEDTYNTLKYATRAKKIKSNMKKNDVTSDLTVAQYKKLVEELNKEVDSLKMKLKTMEETLAANNLNADTSVKSNSSPKETKCSCGENNNKDKELSDKKPAKDPKWRTQLRILLKEKLDILKQIQKLKYTEQHLHYKIKLKESDNNLFKDFCRDDELLEHGQNRINNTVGKFQRQWRDISNTLDGLKKQKNTIESKLNELISRENIEADDKDILQNKVDINAQQIELQNEHTLKVIELYQTENQVKEKFVLRVADKLTTYHQLLHGHGHLTERMDDSFKSLIRSSNGARSVTFQEDEIISCAKSQDSGISVNGCSNSSIQASPPKLNCTFSQEPEEMPESPPKRSSVKRKLYPQSGHDSDSNQSSSLNETITIKTCINADAINSTFSLQEKGPVPKKKTVLSDRSNTVCAENLLPKVHKNAVGVNRKATFQNERNFKINNKYYTSNITKTQRFPIRKNEANKPTGKDYHERNKYFRPSYY